MTASELASTLRLLEMQHGDCDIFVNNYEIVKVEYDDGDGTINIIGQRYDDKDRKIETRLPYIWEGDVDGSNTSKMYRCKYRFHWWQSWKYIHDPQTKMPMLFESVEEVNSKLNELGFELA